MALNKQKILSELGNVMDQLQSADCGCMGKLFSGQRASSPCGGCRRGCCSGHGCGGGNMSGGMSCGMGGGMGGGMPCGMDGSMGSGNQCGMGGGMGSGNQCGMGGGMGSGNQCGMGGGMGSGMPCGIGGGMSRGMGSGMGGSMGGGMDGQMPGSGMGNPLQNLGGTSANNPSPMAEGMGANIVNMMMSRGGGAKPASMPGQGRQLNEPMLIDAPNSPHSQIGVVPLTPPGEAGNMGMSNMNPGGTGMSSMGQGNPTAMMPTTQYITQSNTLPQGHMTTGSMPQQPNLMNANPASQQMMNAAPGGESTASPGHNPYGHHNAGMTKFHEMFPGVMQGDLNFDPMAIAIQMNPANQKRSAMDAINKVMNGNKRTMVEPAITGSHAASTALGQRNAMPQIPTNQQIVSQPSQENTTPTDQVRNQQVLQGQQIANLGKANQQQIYTLQTQPHQMHGQEYEQGTEEYEHENNANPNAPMQQQPQIQETLLPVDPSRNTTAYMKPNCYEYNTLGQPVYMLPGDTYHKPMPGLPQTIAGEYRADLESGTGVKNTISKTAIAGTIPIGKTASRSQLQHIYRQYKASSPSQQNIRPPMQGGPASIRQLHSAPVHANQQKQQFQLLENVGGDTLDNNAKNCQKQSKFIHLKEVQHMGDMPEQNLNTNPSIFEKCPRAIRQKKARNGIQDYEYCPYRDTTGWSFHG